MALGRCGDIRVAIYPSVIGPRRDKSLIIRLMDISLVRQLPDIAALCEQYGVAHLELFGSAAGSDFNAESSDFDFLVELDTQAPGSQARRWTELADALERLLGLHVDLVNPRYIRNPYFLQAVNSSRTVIYDRQNPQAAG